MRFLQEVCSIPTAPFREQRVIDYVRRFVLERPSLRLKEDASGNLLIELPGRKPGRWIFAAHMDHPGPVAARMKGKGLLDAEFRGHVRAEFVQGAKVRFFARDGEIAGRIVKVTADSDGWAERVTVRVAGDVRAGTPGMFDEGEGRVENGKFVCRACDDLAGVAACLEMIDRLWRRAAPATMGVLLTRGEEDGFIGAIASMRDARLLRHSDRVIVVECSAEQPVARQGDGPIIRVGDRTSIFDPALTYFLQRQAAELAKERPGFKWQRALMPGGTCEATVYGLFGHTASSICVALGNYHNMDRQRKCIGPEYVDVDDWKGMVDLFEHIALAGVAFDGNMSELQARLMARFTKLSRRLKER